MLVAGALAEHYLLQTHGRIVSSALEYPDAPVIQEQRANLVIQSFWHLGSSFY
jgi:hypothetical protein